jgi:hypothetical protein
MTTFLVTGCITCHPNYGSHVLAAVHEALADEPGAACLGLKLHTQVHSHLLMWDVARVTSKLYATLREIPDRTHPRIHRTRGVLWSDLNGAEQKLYSSAQFLPDVSVAMITNDTESIQRMWAYWSRVHAN